MILDLSRLVSRVAHPTPTGVDRVEMAYARGLMARIPDRLRFAAVHPIAGYGRLPPATARRFLDETEARWRDQGGTTPRLTRRQVIRTLWRLRPRAVPRGASPRVYVHPSPNDLTRPKLIGSILEREHARLLVLVHDLIPLQYPEYARPDGAELHRRRMATVARQADGILCNSRATMDALLPYLGARDRPRRIAVAHLGVDPPGASSGASPDRPYFVCIGTIEPRKNHLLLLNLWRRFAEEREPASIPQLLVIGRRGWENEQVVDMLDRCPALQDCVSEMNGLPDQQVRALLAGARGLLMPSFAEGYGMPVTEALSLGVPVLCSDLPALREAGGDVPVFMDPLDGPAWMRAIDDLAAPSSPLRQAHDERLKRWTPSTWSDHLDIVANMIRDLA